MNIFHTDCDSQVTRSAGENFLNHDEISTYVESRYISSWEAFWRLSEYKIQDKSHTIIRLPVHLPKQQELYYAEEEEEEE